jgi:hypothetical protein
MRKSWGLLMAAAVAGMAAPGALAQEKPAPTPLVLSGPVDGTHDPSIATEDGMTYSQPEPCVRSKRRARLPHKSTEPCCRNFL